ncbi:MAG: plasmid stabilization protein [Desulfobacteraceae bacterium IS3]|nr:MAG: plasmid stabilization protein [Desulfobacteraceae bacterium IS3]
MKRKLLQSNAFIRSAKRIVRKDPQIADEIRRVLRLLSEDAFHPYLKTHKLKGFSGGSWACRAGYDLRIIFDFVQHEGSDAILLAMIGTHDQVY